MSPTVLVLIFVPAMLALWVALLLAGVGLCLYAARYVWLQWAALGQSVVLGALPSAAPPVRPPGPEDADWPVADRIAPASAIRTWLGSSAVPAAAAPPPIPWPPVGAEFSPGETEAKMPVAEPGDEDRFEPTAYQEPRVAAPNSKAAATDEDLP